MIPEKFHTRCRENALNYRLEYSECSNQWELEIWGLGEGERWYVKKGTIPDIFDYIWDSPLITKEIGVTNEELDDLMRETAKAANILAEKLGPAEEIQEIVDEIEKLAPSICSAASKSTEEFERQWVKFKGLHDRLIALRDQIACDKAYREFRETGVDNPSRL